MRIGLRSDTKNKRTLAGAAIVFLFLVVSLFANIIAPYDYKVQSRNEPASPRSTIRFVGKDDSLRLRPFIYSREISDPLRMTYREVDTQEFPIGLFVRGDRSKFLGLFETDLHFFGVIDRSEKAPRLRLLGTDGLGRDIFSRLVNAIRFSLLVSPLGALLACLIGIFVGIVSGYASRSEDTLIMGITDAMLSLPTLIIILAARAAFPLELSPLSAGILMVSIFALAGWAEIARLTRGLVLSAKEREYVLAAKATGVSGPRILFRHILPNISRPLVTQATLIVPAFLIAETALSFLGVGLQEPEPSLGNLLSAASELTLLRGRPIELLSPAICIFVFVIGVRLLADGIKQNSQIETRNKE